MSTNHFFSLILLFFCMITATVQAQNIEKVNVDQLKKMYQKDNDTTYVINFWATWCVPCIKELPHFEKINQQENVKVILVSLDFPKMVESRLIPFIKEKGLNSKVVWLDEPDENEMIPKISKEWSGAIPATIVINRERRYYKFHEGKLTYEELQKLVNR